MEEDNGLGNAKRWLDRRVRGDDKLRKTFMVDRGSEPSWKQSTFQSYEASVERFLEHLLILFHMTGEQPVRESEVLSIRWRNTDMIRNTFIDYGLVVGIPRYNKTRSVSGKDRPIPRFLPIHYGLRKSTGFPVSTDPGEIHALPSLSGFPSVVFQP